MPAMKQFGVYRVGGRFEKVQPGEAISSSSQSSSSDVECIEHWDGGDIVTYLLDGEQVDQRQVNYGRVPYFQMGGHMTSSRQPDEMYHSIIQPFAHLIPSLDSMLTMMTNRAYTFSYPYLRKIKGDEGIIQAPDDPNSVIDLKPGMILKNVEFMQEIGPSNLIRDQVQLLNMMIDRSGLAAVMYGSSGGTTSGYQVSQLMTAAQLVYAPIISNARMALEQMIPFMWQLIERRMKRKVFVWGAGTGKGEGDWMGLGPDDIDHYYACEVRLKPLMPMDEIAQRDSAARMVQSGLWSEEHARIHTGLEQPEVEADQISVEKMLKSPKLEEILMQDAAERAGVIKPEPPAPPQPVLPPMPPQLPMGMGMQPGLVGPDGMPLPGMNMAGAMPQLQGIGPSVPGVSMPLVPSQIAAPQGIGGRPVGIQRQPGNFPTRPGPV